MNDSEAPKNREPAPPISQRRRSYAARKRFRNALGNLEKDLAHATRDASIVLETLQEHPQLLGLISAEDLDRWKYPLADLQRALDEVIRTFASLGRS